MQRAQSQQATLYVLGQGRASDLQLLGVARSGVAISLAGHLMLVYIWIPSEQSVAEGDRGKLDCDNGATPEMPARGRVALRMWRVTLATGCEDDIALLDDH